jgi:hypothetical protein
MPAPLSVGKVVLGAFLVPWWKRRAFARALAIPLALLVTLTISWYYATDTLPDFAKWLLYLLYGVLFTLFAVRCHRLVLLDSEPLLTELKPQWSRRESRFFAQMIVVWLIFVAMWWVLLFAVSTVAVNAWEGARGEPSGWIRWIIFLSKIPALYVFSRLCLIFPATAIDRKPDLKWSWQLTRGNGWRLVLVVAVLPWLISQLVNLLYRGEATVLETIVLTILGTALFAVEIAALSISYRELTKEAETPASPGG